MLAHLFEQHRQLLVRAAELDALLKRRDPAVSAIARVRWQISNLIERHLTAQERVMRSFALAGLAPVEQTIFKIYFEELAALQASYAEYNLYWTVDALCADWPGYQKAATHQITGLTSRIAWEEQFLFPVLARLATTEVEQRKAA